MKYKPPAMNSAKYAICTKMEELTVPNVSILIKSMPCVSGVQRTMLDSQSGRIESGKNEPLNKVTGSKMIFTSPICWKLFI